jgi:hypothetical protein
MNKLLNRFKSFILSSLVVFGANAQTQVNFTYTGSPQIFTVPCGVDSIFIEAWGGQGQSGIPNPAGAAAGNGGFGGYASGWKQVSQGDVFTIFVGGAGANGTGGYNGGGNGGDNLYGAGGGASDIRFGGVLEADRILVAGGGGGGGNSGCTDDGSIPGIGGSGGSGNGGAGSDGADSQTGGGFAGGGKGGNYGNTQGAFGPSGIGCGGFLGLPGNSTNSAVGANGGGGQNCCCFSGNTNPSGGAGGGGYIGGGSGGGGSAGTTGCSGNSKGAGGGGGGGSSYVGGVINGVISVSQLAGNGQVVITYNGGAPAAPTVQATGQGICAGSTLPVTCTSVNGATNYVWTSTGGLTIVSGQGTNNITVSSSASGTLSVVAVNGPCNLSSIASLPLSLDFYPSPMVTAAVTPNTVCAGDSVVFSAQGASNYQWSNGAVNGATVLPTASGTFTVTGLDTNGCSSAVNVTLTVNQSSVSQVNLTGLDSVVFNNTTYDQNGTYTQILQNVNGCDSVITVNVSLDFTGVIELANLASVYPNPTQSTLTVHFTKPQFASYSVLNIEGKEVMNGTLNGLNTVIDLGSVKPGIYHLRFSGETTVVRLTKI